MTAGEKLIGTVRHMIRESRADTAARAGTVESVNPLTVRLNSGVQLDASFVIVPAYMSDLAAGDSLLLLPFDDGQRFYVMQRNGG